MTRRLAVLVSLLASIAIALVTLGAAREHGPGMYKVDALFDNADYLVPGQQVKVAGAVVGSVTGLHLTPDHKARVEMSVQTGFAPFRSDASCEIRPESLIGEKFIQCDPGSPEGAPLSGSTPVVPLANDHAPIDIDLVLSALRLPYRERLSLFVDELGTGLAGRPADLDAAIRRASPALDEAHRVLSILSSDRATLGRLIDASDGALAELASHRGDVASFIAHADTVTAAIASRRSDLGEAIHRLPPLLSELEPASVELSGFATDARPIARDLRSAAAPVNALLGDLGPLTTAAHPTLIKLSELSATGLRTVRHTMPVARRLLSVTNELPPNTVLLRQLTESLRGKGALEGILKFIYFAAESEARFDETSHILPTYEVFNFCNFYATKPVAGCSAHWANGSQANVPQSSTPAPTSARTNARAARSRGRTSATAAAPPTSAAPTPRPATPGAVPSTSAPPTTTVDQLLSYLLAP